jgi:hypothetical protein
VLLRPIPQIRLRGPRVRPPSTPIGDPAKLGVQAIKPSGPRVAGPSNFAEAGWHTISDSRTTYGLSLSGGGPITLLKQTVRRRICRSGPRMRRDCGHGLRTNRRVELPLAAAVIVASVFGPALAAASGGQLAAREAV